MKPDWKDAPEWANWLAMDGDGCWHWFEFPPDYDDVFGAWRKFGGSQILAGNVRPSYDSLEERPEAT